MSTTHTQLHKRAADAQSALDDAYAEAGKHAQTLAAHEANGGHYLDHESMIALKDRRADHFHALFALNAHATQA